MLPTNTSLTNFEIFTIDDISVHDEYVNATSIDKALIKQYQNIAILANYLNWQFNGNLNSTGAIIASDIKPIVNPPINFNQQFYIGLNEKTAPQVLNRIFANIYAVNKSIIAATNIMILNPENNITVASSV